MNACKLAVLLGLALLTRLACPWPRWVPWGALQAALLVAVVAPVWIAAGLRAGRATLRALGVTWLFLAAALTFESLPDRSEFGVVGHTAALLYALAACWWLRADAAAFFGWRLGDRRSRRALAVVAGVMLALFAIALVLLRAHVIASPSSPPRASLRETLVFQFLIVAVEEELVWRGFVQSFLDDALPGRVRLLGADLGWGALISALAFTLMHHLHVQLDPLGVKVTLGPQLVLALLFVYLRAYARSIWPAAALHGLWNGLGNLLAFL
jgi:membrane protease YdiL (CAAX protease family)